MINVLKRFLNKVLKDMFKKKSHVKLGLYGPPNGGKTTLANKICEDWLGEEMGSVSNVAHETREIQIKEQVNIKSGNKELSFNLVDTPGISTRTYLLPSQSVADLILTSDRPYTFNLLDNTLIKSLMLFSDTSPSSLIGLSNTLVPPCKSNPKTR